MSFQEIRLGVRRAMERSPHRSTVRRIALFGSRLSGQASPTSDVDLLIEFQKPVGFFTLIQVQEDLEQQLGMKVDLVTPKSLSRYIRDEILRDAKVVYEG